MGSLGGVQQVRVQLQYHHRGQGWDYCVGDGGNHVEGGRKAQHLLDGGAVSSPHGCFMIHPWGHRAKNLVEVGDNRIK